MIVTKNLQKSFHGNKVLCGIDEHIEKGEKVVVIGPSGSGKSTFLRCLNLLEEPTGGEVWFEGNNITSKDCDINKLRQKMGMVFQQFNLFPHLSIKENIMLAPVKLGVMTKAEAEKLLAALKKELMVFLDDMEALAAKGSWTEGKNVHFFVSSVNFETSYSYVETQHCHLTMIKSFTLNDATSPDEAIFQRMKKWMQSLIRTSTLISRSGEKDRIVFFEEQRRIVDTL